VLASLNGSPLAQKRNSAGSDFGVMPYFVAVDSCQDLTLSHISARDSASLNAGVTRRQVIVTSGYTTTDDFGTD